MDNTTTINNNNTLWPQITYASPIKSSNQENISIEKTYKQRTYIPKKTYKSQTNKYNNI